MMFFFLFSLWNNHVLLCSPPSGSQKSSHHTERPVPSRCFVLVIQGLCTSVLALINSLVMLLISPHCLHSTEPCSLLVYLDPALSLLAVITLIATALPQVRVQPTYYEDLKKKNIHVCCYFCCSFCCLTSKSLQVHKYGLLLLQSTPPHICVSDLGRRIASIPGVQAVHNLHVWQLTESFTVASVHVHCHAGFPAHRWSGKSLYYFLYHGH